MKKSWCFIPGKFRISGSIFFFLLFTIPQLPGQTEKPFPGAFKNIFGDRYEEAIRFLSTEKWIKETFVQNSINPEFAVAIIFPELIRYSFIQDYLELQGLFTLYVQYGALYANFSVGRFQMKPTFAEQVEKDAVKYLKNRLVGTSGSGLPEERLERVKRLQSLQWQVKYLVTFIRIMDRRFYNLQWESAEKKLRFYATAFNSGYSRSEKYLLSRIKVAGFHVALFEPGERFCYSDISVDYFHRVGFN